MSFTQRVTAGGYKLEDAASAMQKSIQIEKAGRYHVWVRAFSSANSRRGLQMAVNGERLKVTHDQTERRWSWQLAGSVDLPAGEAKIGVHDADVGFECADAMKKRGNDPHSRQRGDSDEFAAFRQRMAEPEYQELYKQRPSIAEFPNAECRNRGCRLLRVRGMEKVLSVALLYASTFNLMRMINLKAI